MAFGWAGAAAGAAKAVQQQNDDLQALLYRQQQIALRKAEQARMDREQTLREQAQQENVRRFDLGQRTEAAKVAATMIPGGTDNLSPDQAAVFDGTPYAPLIERKIPSQTGDIPMAGLPSLDGPTPITSVMPSRSNTGLSKVMTPQEREAARIKTAQGALSDAIQRGVTGTKLIPFLTDAGADVGDFAKSLATPKDPKRQWVTRNGKPVYVDEAAMQPGDAPYEKPERPSQAQPSYVTLTGLKGEQIQVPQGAQANTYLGKGWKVRDAVSERQAGQQDQAMEATRTTRSQLRDLAQGLLTDPSLDAISGPLDARTPDVRPNSVDAARRLKQLVDMLSLDARAKLKGQGTISNFEAQMLANAVTSIDRAAGAENVRKHLREIVNSLDGDAPREGQPPPAGAGSGFKVIGVR